MCFFRCLYKKNKLLQTQKQGLFKNQLKWQATISWLKCLKQGCIYWKVWVIHFEKWQFFARNWNISKKSLEFYLKSNEHCLMIVFFGGHWTKQWNFWQLPEMVTSQTMKCQNGIPFTSSGHVTVINII